MKSLFLSIALGAAATVTASAATSVQFTITLVTVPEGSSSLQIGQKFNGTLTWSAVVPTTGSTTLTPISDSTITLSFDFDGKTYTQQDDDGLPAFPELFFQNGILKGISFEAANKSSGSLPEGFVAIETSNHLTYSYDGNGEYDAVIAWASPVAVPEPASLLFVSASSLMLTFSRRKAC